MQKEVEFSTGKKYELVDITEELNNAVSESKVKNGLCTAYVPHATCAIMINENYDPNICDDIIEALGNLIPEGKWRHDKIDNNAAAHIKSAIIGPSETIPVKDGKLMLGTWQSPMLCDFDGPKRRRIIITVFSC